MTRHKVLFVVAVGGHGGPVASLRDILPGLKRYERVCIGSWTDVVRVSLEDERAETIHTMVRPVRQDIPKALLTLRRVIRLERPRVVFANGLTEASLVALAMIGLGNARRVPVVVWIHNSELPGITPYVTRMIRRLDVRWRAVSPLAADLALNNNLADDVDIIPNPIADDVAAEPVPSNGSIRVSYLGTDKHVKGPDLLPAIMELTQHLPIQWRLHMSERPGHPVWTRLQPLLADPSLDIEVIGKVSPVSLAYAEADLVIVPSRQESFCRVAAEAMANRIPVIATGLSPIRNLLGDDEAGILVDKDDVQGFAAALDRLVPDAELRRTMGEAGLIRSKRYALEIVQQAWVDTIDETIASS